MNKVFVTFLALLVILPATGLLIVTTLTSSPTGNACVPRASLVVRVVPISLTATTGHGVSVTLDRAQLGNAATIITTGSETQAVGQRGVLIALMAALTESRLRMLANPSAYPESATYPNDGDGSDNDSLGLFQMRPAAGWGSVSDLMDPTFQARAFFGGPSGPNYPSPRGLLDIVGWQNSDPGAAAQAVEVSAFPDRYRDYQPVAEAILAALTQGPAPTGEVARARSVSEREDLVFPLPAATWTETDDFGWRFDPVTGTRSFHAGTDLAAGAGTPILALADGVVSFAGSSGSYGGLIVIEHTIGRQRLASAYAHMWPDGILVGVGDHIVAGQRIGDVGSDGKSTGPHLHFEIRPGGGESPAIDAGTWLADHGVKNVDSPTPSAPCLLAQNQAQR